jgi:hypothetical protein
MAVPPTQKEMLDVARRWQAAVKVVDEQIRTRPAAVFDAAEVGPSAAQAYVLFRLLVGLYFPPRP